MTTPRVVITGMGAVSPHGKGVKSLWDGLLAGHSAFRPITLFDAKAFRNPLAGEVDGYPAQPGSKPRALRMLGDACAEAVADALSAPGADATTLREKVKGVPDLASAALVAGTNFGGMSAAETALIDGETDPTKASLESYLFGAATAGLAREYGLGGPRLNLSLSCASGAAAIGVALDLIRQGRVPAAIACSYDELSLFVYAGLCALRAVTPETIRPFDKRRKGTLFSEGAGVMVLERLESAKARGAHVYAEILGRAINNDAYHMTAPEQEAHGIRALMRAALADAKVPAERIGHLNLHATGTPYNDKIETKAVLDVFGARGKEIPVAAIKSSIGHTMGAAGLIESIAAVKSLNEGLVPPVVGLDPAEKDPECDLKVAIGAPLQVSFDVVMKTSYGFGGTNAAVVMGRWPATPAP
jgi:3-oxoacyl-[acyl-carrier-protein] synthase II